MNNIHILWPTARPYICINTFNHWINTAFDKSKIKLYIAVNTLEEKNKFPNDWNVTITGNHVGVTWPTTILSQNLIKDKTIPDDDIVILCSDDMWSPLNWDLILCDEFKEYNGCIIFNDNYQLNEIITLPIMTFNTLKQLNGYIYHSMYCHSYSDNELYDNLKELNLLKDIRKSKSNLIFEHKHHCNNKRPYDNIDYLFLQKENIDHILYDQRKKLSLKEKLI